jgi:peroxiredoxin
MIRKYLKIVTILVILIIIMSFSDKEITCVIKGKVIGRNSDTIILIKATDNIKLLLHQLPSSSQILIPIRDSIFEFKLIIPKTEAYTLIFKDEFVQGFFHAIFVFPENGEIFCTLYPYTEYNKDQVTGGMLNSEYYNYQKIREETFMARRWALSDSIRGSRRMEEVYKNLKLPNSTTLQLNPIDNRSKDEYYVDLIDIRRKEEEKRNNDERGKIDKEEMRFKYNYIAQNPSIISYYFMYEDLSWRKHLVNIDDVKKNYAILSKKYPNHPYTPLIKNLLDAYVNIKVGNYFIDFSASDLNGKIYKLSEIFKDKIGYIDLWSTFCGPCIMKSRSMIPIYKEFKDKGFTICGVAGEIKNTDAMRKIIEKEEFPWINLVELDHKNQIWERYGVTRSAGATFLIDKDGKILAIDPTAEEVRKILNDKLK